MRNVLTFASAAVAALTCALAGAQETPGVSPITSGAVVKGKAPVAKQLLRVRFPKPKSFKLKNGVTVYVLEDHRLPVARFRLIMRAGVLFQPKPGIAEMTAGMLTEGTKSRTYQQIAEESEEIGATLNASAETENATLSATGLSESTDKVIALMADALLHPTFPDDRLERVKFQQESQIAQRRSSPAVLLGDLSKHVFYGDTPYGRLSPKRDEIAAVTREDLAAFHAAFYVPNGALLGVTGDVNVNELKAKLESAFAEWKPGTKTAEPPSAADLHPKETAKVYLVDRPGSAQTALLFGNLAIQRTDPDYIPLVVANRILGGGSSGRLFQNIREKKGYTYGAYSSVTASLWPGLWTASANVRTPVTEPAAKEFVYELNRIQDEIVPESEIDRAKRSIVGSFARTLESPEEILGLTLELVQNGLPLDYWDTYPSRIEGVSAGDIQRVAQKYLGKGRMQVLAIGERSKIEDGLKQFGTVEIVDATQLVGATGGGAGGRR